MNANVVRSGWARQSRPMERNPCKLIADPIGRHGTGRPRHTWLAFDAAAPITRRIFVAACTLILSTFVTETHARYVGEIGGNGGGPFVSACRPNDVVIGFNMRSGTALDAIVPICIALNPQGTEWTGAAYEPTRYWGGGGGGYQKIACQPGDAVRHFHVYAGPWGDINVVKHVRMTCQDLGSGNWYNVVPAQLAGTVTMDKRFSCADGEWGMGMYGRSGTLVDQLGFICGTIARAAAPAPAGQPQPSPQAQAILEAHNRYRAKHCAPNLTWSTDLANGAQAWANACTPDPQDPNRFAHSTVAWANENCCGENLYWGTTATANQAVDWWYSEIARYNFDDPIGSFNAGRADRTKAVGHFTQLVWKNSKQLGCAMALCRGQNFWVCRYAPTGNWNVETPGVLAANVLREGCPSRTQSSPLPQQDQAAPAQGERGEWSAFATDERGNWGYGAHWATEQAAQKLAIDGCGGSGIGCKVFWTTRDRCVSYTESRAGGYWYAAGGGGDEQQAIQNGIRFCQSGTAPPNSCKSVVAECR